MFHEKIAEKYQNVESLSEEVKMGVVKEYLRLSHVAVRHDRKVIITMQALERILSILEREMHLLIHSKQRSALQ